MPEHENKTCGGNCGDCTRAGTCGAGTGNCNGGAGVPGSCDAGAGRCGGNAGVPGSCNAGAGRCGGNAGVPGSCNAGAGVLELTEAEILVLGRFAQIPFWPVARRADSESPICLEEDVMRPETLSALAVKGLIRLDFDLPLQNFDYAAYDACPHRGSMALTAAGQNVIELLDVQGADE